VGMINRRNPNDLPSYTLFVPVLDNFLYFQICIIYMYLTNVSFYQMYELVMMFVFIQTKNLCSFNESNTLYLTPTKIF